MPLSDIYNRFNLQADPYDTMGVDKKCQEQDIRRAYYKLAVRFHPDKNNGAEGRFKEILNAYAVLSDPHKRREYDILTRHSSYNQEVFGDLFDDYQDFANAYHADYVERCHNERCRSSGYNKSEYDKMAKENSKEFIRRVKQNEIPPGYLKWQLLKHLKTDKEIAEAFLQDANWFGFGEPLKLYFAIKTIDKAQSADEVLVYILRYHHKKINLLENGFRKFALLMFDIGLEEFPTDQPLSSILSSAFQSVLDEEGDDGLHQLLSPLMDVSNNIVHSHKNSFFNNRLIGVDGLAEFSQPVAAFLLRQKDWLDSLIHNSAYTRHDVIHAIEKLICAAGEVKQSKWNIDEPERFSTFEILNYLLDNHPDIIEKEYVSKLVCEEDEGLDNLYQIDDIKHNGKSFSSTLLEDPDRLRNLPKKTLLILCLHSKMLTTFALNNGLLQEAEPFVKEHDVSEFKELAAKNHDLMMDVLPEPSFALELMLNGTEIAIQIIKNEMFSHWLSQSFSKDAKKTCEILNKVKELSEESWHQIETFMTAEYKAMMEAFAQPDPLLHFIVQSVVEGHSERLYILTDDKLRTIFEFASRDDACFMSLNSLIENEKQKRMSAGQQADEDVFCDSSVDKILLSEMVRGNIEVLLGIRGEIIDHLPEIKKYLQNKIRQGVRDVAFNRSSLSLDALKRTYGVYDFLREYIDNIINDVVFLTIRTSIEEPLGYGLQFINELEVRFGLTDVDYNRLSLMGDLSKNPLAVLLRKMTAAYNDEANNSIILVFYKDMYDKLKSENVMKILEREFYNSLFYESDNNVEALRVLYTKLGFSANWRQLVQKVNSDLSADFFSLDFEDRAKMLLERFESISKNVTFWLDSAFNPRQTQSVKGLYVDNIFGIYFEHLAHIKLKNFLTDLFDSYLVTKANCSFLKKDKTFPTIIFYRNILAEANTLPQDLLFICSLMHAPFSDKFFSHFRDTFAVQLEEALQNSWYALKELTDTQDEDKQDQLVGKIQTVAEGHKNDALETSLNCLKSEGITFATQSDGKFFRRFNSTLIDIVKEKALQQASPSTLNSSGKLLTTMFREVETSAKNVEKEPSEEIIDSGIQRPSKCILI